MSVRRKLASALRWDPRLPAPYVLARGRGLGAERIEALARGAGVPVVEDAAAAEAFDVLDAGDFVPIEYWELAAAVLATVAFMERK